MLLFGIGYQNVIARSEATKQSIPSLYREMDCFASLAITDYG
jgi:hypothetical protein